MQAYKIVGKAHRRVSQVHQIVMTTDGQKLDLVQNGPLILYQVGDVLEDVTPDELAAHPDRFQAATAAEIDAFRAKQAAANVVMQAPGFTTAQADQHAALERQIQDLLAKQRAIVDAAETPVPMTKATPEHASHVVRSEATVMPDVHDAEVTESPRRGPRH